LPQDKVRVYVLARELNLESKDLLDLCQQANIDVKNQLSSLDPEQRDLLVEMVRKGGSVKSAPSSPVKPPVVAPPPPVQSPMRNLDRRPAVPKPHEPPPVPPPVPVRPETRASHEAPPIPPVPPPIHRPAQPEAVKPETPRSETPTHVPAVPLSPVSDEVPARAETPAPEVEETAPGAPAPEVPAPAETSAAARPTPEVPAAKGAEPPSPREVPPDRSPEALAPAVQVPPLPEKTGPGAGPAVPPAAATQTPEPPPGPTAPPQAPQRGAGPVGPRPAQSPMRDLSGGGGGGQRQGGGKQGDRRDRPTHRIVTRPQPTGRPAATPKQQKPSEEKKPAQTGPRRIGEIPPELMQGDKPLRIEDLLRPPTSPRAGGTPAPTTEVEVVEDDEEARGKGGAAKKRGTGSGSGVVGRDQRHADRAARAKERQAGRPGRGGIDLLEDDRPRRIGTGIKKQKRPQPKGTQPRKGKVPIDLPITVRSLSEAMGVRANDVLRLLMEHGAPMSININSTLEPDLAEALALEREVELHINRPPNAEETLVRESEKEDNPEDLVLRAPIVTIMGHVDHGKTSLLDRIRSSNVVATEAGGITQSLRAWRVEHNGRPVTFLDTPGHEAFTKMRARGANVTDVAVIVVAADDGVMPQTEEAISHAKAAGVSIVVALNKIDLPNANIRRAEQQLYGLELIPDTMGGEVPFVQTSAQTGKGIDELLETLSVVAELKELKANPNRSAVGTCLEATVNEGEGVTATVLIRNGTLHRGDVVVCGPAHGRIRAMYDDRGQLIQDAGPSVPVRITGLDRVPNADDSFLVVTGDDALTVARDVAEKRQDRLQEASITARAPMTIESLGEIKVAELKVILKADVRGSIEAIRKEIEKYQHDEVRVRVLHMGVGGINENDVNLALTSPQDTIIVGFNVVPDDRAKALADERGIQIREYNIIYNLTNDIKSALEGKLKPREEVVHLGRAVVREVFKISRVGSIAGCYATQGTIERSGLVRVIRNGVVIYPPADRSVGMDSLKRFKEDVREVQQGYECGIKVSGYDDIKVDDVIECYRIQKVQRTLG
jgi:translation initiation factor IF-2